MRISFLKSSKGVFIFLWALLCLAGPLACTGGLSGGGVSPMNTPPGTDPTGLTPPPPGATNAATGPDVMGPKGDDSHMGDNDWVAGGAKSDGQRLRYGAVPESAAVVDPNGNPTVVHIPYDGTLNLSVEVLLDGVWKNDVTGPYIRLVYLPLDATGKLSMNGFFQDLQLRGKDAQGWNAVFAHLKLSPGELSVWYYEQTATPKNKQNWEDALFFPPPLNVPFQEEMAPINFSDFWDFAADSHTRHLGRFRQESTTYQQNPHQNFRGTSSY